jgi:hypothetical protein
LAKLFHCKQLAQIFNFKQLAKLFHCKQLAQIFNCKQLAQLLIFFKIWPKLEAAECPSLGLACQECENSVKRVYEISHGKIFGAKNLSSFSFAWRKEALRQFVDLNCVDFFHRILATLNVSFFRRSRVRIPPPMHIAVMLSKHH